MIPQSQAAVARFLAHLAGGPAIETHISAVFRGPDTAWKLKKAVRLGFLDFSALADRKRFLDRELALNAPHTPGLYREVLAVTRNEQGLALGGAGVVLDWVLCMAAVAEDQFLDHQAAAGRVDAAMLTQMADAVAAMHAAQVPLPAPSLVADPVARLRAVADGNAAAALAAGIGAAAVARWRARLTGLLEAAAPLLHARAGLVRRAHGDLHLGNLVLWQGRPAPFDALEFDEDLATIDPGYDLAFLLMDVEQRVSRAAANQLLNRYVARTGDAGLVGPLPAFLSLRAMIRAHVEAARGREHAGLVAAALDYPAPGRAMVVAVGGLMGTGKSTLARAVAPGLGAAPGALVLRSDEVRKRLSGVAPEQRLPAAAYTEAAHRRTEAALLEGVAAAITGGHAVVADATFLGAEARDRVAAAARAAGAAFAGFWLEAPLAELERRLLARRGDASDAGRAVLRAAATAQAAAGAPAGWLRVDARDAAAAQQQVQTRLAML